MKDPTFLSVRNTLAEFLNVQPAQVKPDQRLERDWGLDRVELNVVALRLEETEDLEIRGEELESVHTVGQLVALVRSIRRREEVATEVTRVRSRRGIRAAAPRTAAALAGLRQLKLQGSGS